MKDDRVRDKLVQVVRVSMCHSYRSIVISASDSSTRNGERPMNESNGGEQCRKKRKEYVLLIESCLIKTYLKSVGHVFSESCTFA